MWWFWHVKVSCLKITTTKINKNYIDLFETNKTEKNRITKTLSKIKMNTENIQNKN